MRIFIVCSCSSSVCYYRNVLLYLSWKTWWTQWKYLPDILPASLSIIVFWYISIQVLFHLTCLWCAARFCFGALAVYPEHLSRHFLSLLHIQVFVSLKHEDVSKLKMLNRCLDLIKSWMAENFIQLNELKTEVLVHAPNRFSVQDNGSAWSLFHTW